MGKTIEAVLESDKKNVVVVRGSLIRNPHDSFRFISVEETRSSKSFFPESSSLLPSQLVEEMVEHAQLYYRKKFPYMIYTSLYDNSSRIGTIAVGGLLERDLYDNLYITITAVNPKRFFPSTNPSSPDTLVGELSLYGEEYHKEGFTIKLILR